MDHANTLALPADEDSAERLSAALAALLTRVSMFQHVKRASTAERRLWRACELCSFLEYRVDGAPDPRSLSDEAILDWARRGLTSAEAPGDPADLGDYLPYWVVIDGRTLGTVALSIRGCGFGRPSLWIASLYVFPEERRKGYATLITATLGGIARHLGLAGCRLDTDWLWQGAVRFYLRQGFWVANWKRGLSLVRSVDARPYRIWVHGSRMDFVLGGEAGQSPVIRARRQGGTLVWEPFAVAGAGDQGYLEPGSWVAPTFALWLAVSGWPLIRGPADWERRYNWSDTGMPEGLAYKITVFEAYARRCGFRVDTPRIPGLDYPDWEELQS